MKINIIKEIGVVVDVDSSEIVLNCSDIPLQHWSLNIEGLAVIMNVNHCGSEPEVAIRNGKIFLGAEQGIFVINMKTLSVESAIVDVANVQWIEGSAPNQIVIAAEDEVIVLDNFGKILWRKNLPDLIQATNIVAEHLQITDISGGEYDFNLLDGSQPGKA